VADISSQLAFGRAVGTPNLATGTAGNLSRAIGPRSAGVPGCQAPTATICEAAAEVEPHLPGHKILSLMQLERQLHPEASSRRTPRRRRLSYPVAVPPSGNTSLSRPVLTS
jgi:hypothetical protein